MTSVVAQTIESHDECQADGAGLRGSTSLNTKFISELEPRDLNIMISRLLTSYME